jgi:hypothetical protein
MDTWKLDQPGCAVAVDSLEADNNNKNNNNNNTPEISIHYGLRSRLAGKGRGEIRASNDI